MAPLPAADVRLEVGLGFLELVEEPVRGDVGLVDVPRVPVHAMPAAHVTHFERRVARQLALPADGIGLGVRHLNIRIESVQADVRRRRHDRIRRHRGAWQRRIVPEKNRQRRVGRVTVERHLNALVATEGAGEVRHAGTLKRHRRAAAQDAVAFFGAEEEPADAVVGAGCLPCGTKAGC